LFVGGAATFFSLLRSRLKSVVGQPGQGPGMIVGRRRRRAARRTSAQHAAIHGRRKETDNKKKKIWGRRAVGAAVEFRAFPSERRARGER